IAAKDNGAVIINHAPLLLESPFAVDKNNVIIVIWCSPETQKERLLKRGYPQYEEGLKLMEAQMPYEEKVKYAHHVINNNGAREETQAEVERVYNLLKVFEYTEKLNIRHKKSVKCLQI
ncbi:MAG: dephospho-CoA kinase, partial [Deferribacteraceae bacterium]|nr:dephospho-CoA kinase [Deferribacteraceae bacterium]